MVEVLKDRLVISNDTRYLVVVREFIRRMYEAFHPTREEANRVVLAVDEAVTNIMEHGYGPDRSGNVEIEATCDGREFRVVIRDTGRGFDPRTVPMPDVGEHVRKGRKRGLGLFLMRQIMDEVTYGSKGSDRNELTMVKYLKPRRGGPWPVSGS